MAVIINGDTGIDKVQDGSIVNADIASGIDAAKLTGTLPALDASSLTGIPAPAALSTASGSAPSYSARAWVNWGGQGTVAIRGSQNVSSVTDNGTGDYTVNFTTAMLDANYSYVSSGREGTSNNNRSDIMITAWASNTVLAGSIKISTANASNAGITDAETACIAIFR